MVSTPNTFDYTGIDIIMNGDAVNTATMTITSNTTLAAIPGLTISVNPGGIYILNGFIHGTSAASGGLNLQFTGTAAVSALNVSSWNYNGSTLNSLTNITSLSSSLTNNAAQFTDIEIEGGFACSTGGTLILQAAQNTSNATSTTIAPYSYISIIRVR